MVVAIVTALIAITAWTAGASAQSQQLNCTLTDTADQLGSENRPIIITFDQDAKALKAQDGSKSYSFGDVWISNIAISGNSDGISLGIDRSSQGIVWQQYGAGKPVIEFGECRQSAAPAADIH
ncbi:MAG: hypothetical protein WB760_30360 [Xanthobacteraceae bacterium]